jgi:hypothetical protein
MLAVRRQIGWVFTGVVLLAPAGQTWMRPGNEVKIGHATDS